MHTSDSDNLHVHVSKILLPGKHFFAFRVGFGLEVAKRQVFPQTEVVWLHNSSLTG